MKKFLLPFFLFVIPWMAGAQHTSYLSPKDMDIFIRVFYEVSEVFTIADYDDLRWLEYMERLASFSGTMDRFYVALSNNTAGDFAQYKYQYHKMMDVEVPPPVEAVFKKAGWAQKGHKKFWTIVCGFAYIQHKNNLENGIMIRNHLEELYSRYLDLFDHYNVFSENDLAIISTNLGAFDALGPFDVEALVLTYGIGESISLDKNNAPRVRSYTNDPRSILAYFYASLLRGDDLWREVVTPDENNPPGIVPFDEYFKNINLVKVVIGDCVLKSYANTAAASVHAAIDFEQDSRSSARDEEATFILDDGIFKLDIINSSRRRP